jgi:type IV pilus assembly protein PilW
MMSFNNQMQSGFSIIELMVAATISMVLLAGVMTLFSNSRQTYESNERLARLQENGRFALDQMTHDIRSAGYKGCSRRMAGISPFNNMLHHNGSLLWNFGVPLQGYEATTASTWSPAVDSLVISPQGGHDILIVRGPKRDSLPMRVTAPMFVQNADITVADPGSADLKTNDVVLVSNCYASSALKVTGYLHNTGTGSGIISHAASAAPACCLTPENNNANAGHSYDDTAEVTPVQTVVYYLRARDPVGNPGLLSLYRRAGTADAEEIIDGVDALQVLYGVDTNNDQWADTYSAADVVQTSNNWSRVVGVSIGILVRSMTEYGLERENARTYQVLGASIGPFSDRHQRMVFTTTATVRNQLQ